MKNRAPEARSQRSARSTGRKLLGALAAFAIGIVPIVVVAAPAQAATAVVTLTPASATAESNVATTFQLSITCNGPGTCDDTQVSFPRIAVTGNGTRTDLSSWVSGSSCGFVSRAVTATDVVFTYGNLGNVTQVCTFTVRAPEYTTLDGAQATLTPTVSGSNIPSTTGTPAVLTLTAGHNNQLFYGASAQIISGGEYSYNVTYHCGLNRQYDGDIGVSALRLEAQLPANFVYSSFAVGTGYPGTMTPPAVGSTGGLFVYDDPTGATCGNPPLNINNSFTIVIRGTVTAPPGTQACSTATATFTYIDRAAPETQTATTTPCPTVVNLETIVGKTPQTLTQGNSGQHTAADGTRPNIYTYPGNWDGSNGSVYYQISANTSPAATNTGVSYLIQDPLPCLDNPSGTTYVSNAVDTLCANPAFIARRIVAFGFTPTASDEITLRLTDGTSTSVPLVAGAWTIPTGVSVAQIDIPPFASQGSNTSAISFRITGQAAATAQPGYIMRNTGYSTPHLVSSGDPLRTAQTSVASILVADPVGASGTILSSFLWSGYAGACRETVRFSDPNVSGRFPRLEITTAQTAPIYLDYLAPEGASVASSTLTFTLNGINNGRTYNSGARTATVIADYNGTGRTLYRWTIPANTATAAGLYGVIATSGLTVDLPAGCQGKFENDMTIGYGSPAAFCAVNGVATVPPLMPADNPDLQANGVGTSNFCGYSTPLNVAAINPGFTVDKTVQGNLDAGPVPTGTDGSVSPAGGVATYSLTFVNSGESTLTDPVIYDILPRVGDTATTSTAARGSDFTVALTGVGALPPGVAVAYSTATHPCRPEVLPSNAGCDATWGSTAPAPLSTVTALRFVYTGSVAVDATFTVTFTVSTPSVAAGNVALNSAATTASAGGVLQTPVESVNVGITAGHAMPEIAKSASVATYDADGETIDFTYTVTNNTAVPLTGVSVSDRLTDAAAGSTPPVVTCDRLESPSGPCTSSSSTSLAAGQVAVFTATYTTRQEDVDHGLLADIATVSAQPATGAALSSESNEVTVTAVQNPALTLDKTVDPTTVDAANDVVEFRFAVENTGNVTLGALEIVEQSFTGSTVLPTISCSATTLPPGADALCTVDYPITQADMDQGSVENTAIARASFDGADVDSAPSTATVTVTQSPSLDLAKSALPTTIGSQGQTITYSFLVTNDGNVTIDAIDVQETAFSGTGTLGAIVCPATALAPDDEMTCTASYQATQDDIDAGTIDNTATVTGDDPAGAAIPTPPTSTVSVAVVFAPALTLVKTADVTRVDRAGDVIRYEFLVLNNGNVTLDGLTIDETSFTGAGTLSAVTCPVSTLAPTDRTTCTAEYTVVNADARGARISNTAEALATYALGGASVSVTSTDSTALVAVGSGVSGGLAETGSSVPRWLLTAALATLLGGLVLVAAGSRRRPFAG